MKQVCEGRNRIGEEHHPHSRNDTVERGGREGVCLRVGKHILDG